MINLVVLFDLLDVLATSGLACGGHVGGGWTSSMSRKQSLVWRARKQMSQMIFHIYFVVLTSFLFKSFKSFVVCVCCLVLHRLGSALQDDDEVVVSITKEDPLGGPRSDRDVTLQVDDARLDSWNAEVFRTIFNDSFAIFNSTSLENKVHFSIFPCHEFTQIQSGWDQLKIPRCVPCPRTMCSPSRPYLREF